MTRYKCDNCGGPIKQRVSICKRGTWYKFCSVVCRNKWNNRYMGVSDE